MTTMIAEYAIVYELPFVFSPFYFEEPVFELSSTISSNSDDGAWHIGQLAGALSPSWIYPQTLHLNFFVAISVIY